MLQKLSNIAGAEIGPDFTNLKEKIIPVHSGKKVPVMALCNKWNEDSGDIIESKHFAKLIKAMGLSVKKKGRSQQNAIHLPNDVSDLNLTL